MTIAVQLDFPDATVDQYDRLIERMGFRPGATSEPGCLFHWVTKTDGGIRVTDVWRDRAQFETFAQDKIGPLSQEVGITSPPVIEFFDVYNYFTEPD